VEAVLTDMYFHLIQVQKNLSAVRPKSTIQKFDYNQPQEIINRKPNEDILLFEKKKRYIDGQSKIV
jgi:hypothetical protein